MKKNILVVDDNQLHRELLSKTLKPTNCEVTTLSSGEECLVYLAENKTDLVLLDIMMPGVSGLDVLKQIREHYKPVELPVILVTAKDEEDDIVNGFNIGANDFITKPIHSGTLIARVQTQLSRTEFYQESLKSKELEALNAMIITYNHEINGSLSIVSVDVGMEAKKNPKFKRTKEAVDKIAKTLKKIENVTKDEVIYREYGKTSNMIALKK